MRPLVLLALLTGLIAPLTAAQPPACDPDVRMMRVSAGFPYGFSDDGRYLVIESAEALLPEDTNTGTDIFRYDRQACALALVSASVGGEAGSDFSGKPSMSANGDWIAFSSAAANLVPDDTNNQVDIFVKQVSTGLIERVSLGPNGVQANGPSWNPAISGNGRYVVFESGATNLIAGGNDGDEIFLRDLQTDETVQMSFTGSHAEQGAWDPHVSADGRTVTYVAFSGINLTDVFALDRQMGLVSPVSVGMNGAQQNAPSYQGVLSASGHHVLFSSDASNLVPRDTNNQRDFFVRDLQAGRTTRVSVSSRGVQGNALSGAPNSIMPRFSADGRLVCFDSNATNLDAGDSGSDVDVFVRDRLTGQTRQVSISAGGVEANHFSSYCTLSADGRFAAFHSLADNLVPGAPDGGVFVARLDMLVPASAAPQRSRYTTRTPVLTWSRVTWAAGYEVQVDGDPRFGSVDCCDVDLGADDLLVQTTPLDGWLYYSATSSSAQSPSLSGAGGDTHTDSYSLGCTLPISCHVPARGLNQRA